jgi:hypothetical protein
VGDERNGGWKTVGELAHRFPPGLTVNISGEHRALELDGHILCNQDGVEPSEDVQMERSDYTSDTNDFGTSEGANSNTGQNASSGTGGSTSDMNQDSGLADKTSSALGGAKDKLADVGSTVRDRAAGAKDSLADMLESGAEKLRQRSADGSLAGSTGTAGSTAVSDDRMSQVTSKVAGGMDATADWLREADLDSLKAGVETQVKEHPGRTLLIAVGLGYLLGKALRK